MRRWVRPSAAALAVVLMFLSGVATYASVMASDAATTEVEVREYQGERLGSVDGFRENSISGVQTVDSETYRLAVDGLVLRPLSMSLQALAEFQRAEKLVTIHCVEGWSVKALWEGIRLNDLFALAGVAGEANTVIFHAADGYTTSLPLGVVTSRDLILADRINGIVLPPANGFPFQLVAEDRWGYKWIRWVTRIEISSDGAYQGFWESRGFNQDAAVDGPILDRAP